MEIDGPTLAAMIEGELATVSDERVTSHIRKLLVEPHVVLRPWDYGEPGLRYPCWTVLRDTYFGVGIAYCQFGFGPRCPWGLVSISDDPDGADSSIGMDSGWLSTLIDIFFESASATALPIWRVTKQEPSTELTVLTKEGEWEDTWRQCEVLRVRCRTSRYNVNHTIAIRRPPN